MTLQIKTTNGSTKLNYSIDKDVWMELASKVFDHQEEKQRGKDNEAMGGPISGFLHAYNMTEAKAKIAGVDLSTVAKGGRFNPTVWEEVMLEPLTEAAKAARKAALAARKLQAAQDEWDARWMKADNLGLDSDDIEGLIGKRPEA